MGTFEKSFSVDGVTYELYRQSGAPTTFQLVTASGALIAGGLTEIPTDDAVSALIGASPEVV